MQIDVQWVQESCVFECTCVCECVCVRGWARACKPTASCNEKIVIINFGNPNMHNFFPTCLIIGLRMLDLQDMHKCMGEWIVESSFL